MKDLERLVVKPNPCAISKSAANQTSKNDKDDDDDVDLFGSDSEEESADAAKIREERLAAYNAKKSKSRASNNKLSVHSFSKIVIVFQNQCWLQSQTSFWTWSHGMMTQTWRRWRKLCEKSKLTASFGELVIWTDFRAGRLCLSCIFVFVAKLVPLAYGIHKLQISCVVEDEKVSVDWLQEQIEAVEDFVQSVDIAAFNKV